MLNKLTPIILLVLLTGCISERVPEHVVVGTRTQNKFIDNICKKYNLHCYAGGGGMMNDIKIIGASFSTRKPHNLQQARELYIKVVDELIDTFNTEPSVQPYLHNNTFNITNTSVKFMFENPDGSPTPGINNIIPYIESDKIRYYVEDRLTQKWTRVHEETYDEAKAILAKQQKELPNLNAE